MSSIPRWQDATLEERGAIRETIYRRLSRHYRHTDVALMHACGLDIETVREALKAMIKSGAVVEEKAKSGTYYSAAVRK